MKIEVGKEYKTRDGRIYAVVYKTNTKGYRSFLAVNTESYQVSWFNENGRCFNDEEQSQTDLVSEAPQKVKVERWLNVFPDGDFTTYDSKEEADGCATDARIACKHIEFEVEEGEGI